MHRPRFLDDDGGEDHGLFHGICSILPFLPATIYNVCTKSIEVRVSKFKLTNAHDLSMLATYHIDKNIVGGNDDLPRRLSRQQSASQIVCIPKTPFNEKEYRQSSSRLQFVILENLRELCKEPCKDAETA